MKNSKFKILGIIALVSILALELLIDHLFVKNAFCQWSWYFRIGIVAIVLLVLSLFFNRKNLFKFSLNQVAKELIKNTVSGSVLDILYIAFFLLHLTWIPDSLFEWIKGDFTVLHPIIFITGLIFAIIVKPAKEKVSGNEFKVLITGISNFQTFPNGNATIETIIKPLDKYKTIDKIVIFIDPEFEVKDVNYFNAKIDNILLEKIKSKDEDFNNNVLEVLKQLTNLKDIILIHCSYEEIQEAYNIIEKQTNILLENGYIDSQLLYNITPGNKNISIALALNSIKKDRDICYIQQSGKNKDKVIREELNVIHLKDAFSELTD